MCSVQTILFPIIDVEYDGTFGCIPRKITHELKQCRDSHSIVGGTWRRRYRVEMSREQNSLELVPFSVNLHQDVVSFEVNASPRIPCCVAANIVRQMDIIVKLRNVGDTREDMGANSVICMRIIRVGTTCYLYDCE
jgi:hypothetical protein